MGKYRSKIKGGFKGKRWQKGQSSMSNPKTHKYREMAKSRFFQENLGNTGLTQQALLKHDAMATYSHSPIKPKTDAENELAIAKELENMSVRSGEDGSETEYNDAMTGTYKTFQTFASDWSQCSNISFSKLLKYFNSNDALHKEMLAVLAAITEVIKEQGGKESSTEYFVALVETLKSSETEDNLIATICLLSMIVKSVPQAVLRKQFSDSVTTLTDILENNAMSEKSRLLRYTINSLGALLKAQEHALWGNSSTMKVFDILLAFVLHSKPKVRKVAQQVVTAILRRSCFMIPAEDNQSKVPRTHPATSRVAEYCQAQMKAETLLSGRRTVLYTLTFLRGVLPVFHKDNIKSTCESILSLMTHNNLYVKNGCLHTLHALFAAAKDLSNLTAGLTVQLIRALTAARPSASDAGQVLAWAAVLQQGYSCLAGLDIDLCVPNIVSFVEVCVSELWLSDVMDINSASTNSLKAILVDCVKPAIESEEVFVRHKLQIEAVFKKIGTGLDNPFNQAIRHVIMTMAVCFEIGNERIAYILGPLLRTLNERRESHNFHNHKEVEYATGCAVKALGPEFVLKHIPLRDSPETINVDRSWLMPVLKEKISKSNLKFFATEILEMATFCRKKSRILAQDNDTPGSHTYDLLCHQLWSLLSSFCNNPKDIKDSFKTLARVLGNVLKDNPEFRLAVMQALRRLISGAESEDDKAELARFAKNYLPILLNIYMSPTKGSAAEGQRLAALETIKVYLTISDQILREELFKNSISQLESSKDKHFQRESILDIIRALVPYQNSENITTLFDIWVFPLCETVLPDPKKIKKARKEKEQAMDEGSNESKNDLRYKDLIKLLEMEHKKAYRILEEIFKSEEVGCKEFLTVNHKKIKKLLMSSLNKQAISCKASRLRCIQHLILSTPFLNADSKLIKSAMAESIVSTKDINSKCRETAFDVINTIGTVLIKQESGMQAFLDLLLSGLSASEPRLVAATIQALAIAVYTTSEQMSLETIQGLMEKVAELAVSENREIAAACTRFMRVYTKVLPSEALLGSVPLIMKTLSSMQEDCKRHLRQETGYLLSKLIGKYDAELVEKFVPATDEVLIRRVRNKRKEESRKKRRKESQREQNESDNDEDLQVKGSSKTFEDILKDSDSESDMEFMDEDEGEKRPKVKAKVKRRSQAWIQDDPENIVDLADVSAARNITATDPTIQSTTEVKQQKKKDGGFKIAPDGRLIIADDDQDDDEDDADDIKPSGEIDSDSDDTDNEADKKPSNLLKPGIKRRYDDILSVKSGRSIKSKASTVMSKYKAGGKGIHRPLGSAASVASTVGTNYSSKKAKGDIKKKGKPDPYAYLPLSRKNLNKRTKAVNSKQFKGVVKSKIKHGKMNLKRKST